MLSSYSLTLYVLPTMMCMVPSIYFRVILLVFQGILRVIFMYRNYSTKLQARGYIMAAELVIF